MTDSMRLLSRVAHNQAEVAADDLEKIADRQETTLDEKKKARDVQEYIDKIKADDIVTFDELVTLHELRTEIGSTDKAFWEYGGNYHTVNEFDPDQLGGVNPWKYDANKYGEKHGNNSHFYLELKGEDPSQRKAAEVFKNIEKEVENHIKGKEDDQSLLQFKIQMFTSDLQNAENVRSQAEKREETQRKDLTRNWGG
jgi:hypothetical protein